MKLKDNLYYVGIANPTLRVFDIIMQTEYGTTYNSYILKGEKTALIEAGHETFNNDYIENIEAVTDIKDIDYLIMNHTEPDHSGSIVKLLEINPNIEIIGTMAAIKFIEQISNVKFKNRIIKAAGEQLDLGGGIVLDFIIAPNLHWPDSMFTYCKQNKTLFSCDFLGAHYCELGVLDTKLKYKEKYDSAFAYYYAAIFGPFKPFVIAGLDKIKDLEIDMVCNSHGPILVDGIKEAIDKYRKWSTPVEIEKNAAIFYVSAYGYTRAMAEHIAKTLNKKGIPTKTYDIIKNDMGELKEILEKASIVMFGTPTINRDALKPVLDLLSVTDAVINRNKTTFVFGSYGWSGEGCKIVNERITAIGLKPIAEPYKVNFKPMEADFIAIDKIMEGIN